MFTIYFLKLKKLLIFFHSYSSIHVFNLKSNYTNYTTLKYKVNNCIINFLQLCKLYFYFLFSFKKKLQVGVKFHLELFNKSKKT